MASILVIDSGVGGISILNAIQKKLPYESYFYFSDFKYFPYGEKSSGFLCERLIDIIEYFIENEEIKAVVIACNTATVAAIQFLRENFKLPIFGIEPGIKPAARKSTNGILVFATNGTLNSEQFDRLVQLYADGKPVYSRAVPDWVKMVENDESEKDILVKLNKALEAVPGKFDTVLLGCTHFSFLKPYLANLLPEDVEVIDTSDAVANWVQEKLSNEKLLAIEHSKKSRLSIYGSQNTVNDEKELFRKLDKLISSAFEIQLKELVNP